MKSLVGLYLVIGIVMLGVGFLFSGPCPERNTDAVSNLVFVLTWPVGLYAEVYHGHYAPARASLRRRRWSRPQKNRRRDPLSSSLSRRARRQRCRPGGPSL